VRGGGWTWRKDRLTFIYKSGAGQQVTQGNHDIQKTR
jgi:hypothetical protein